MHPFHVVLQQKLPGESGAADAALEGLLAGMEDNVTFQVSGPPKSPATELANVLTRLVLGAVRRCWLPSAAVVLQTLLVRLALLL